ncbi:LON peptidase substrate-binding domain-containing protein [Xanthovirga aplysinae]|uniref:LON peptidase substrate-binding domain-containing protein n=1 Tax=Xanthovirga aplysinae TaxID=2529853 RepID=UPI0012BB56F0|nr:LON peptidase substrate-binding domain-containing protein [Xanthovirga aplysinae]MTI32899.1 peptidase [Xanthovirga aplysinae]
MMYMGGELPLLPLQIVLFPGEKLNLHIFEPRYKDLVNDCLALNTNFGIPSYIKKSIEYGTEVEILGVKKIYDDGCMDISVRGEKVFKIENYENPAPGKKYAVGEVLYLEDIDNEEEEVKEEMLQLVRELFMTLNMVKDVQINEGLNAYNLAHKVGMNRSQEYKILSTDNENDRQLLVINHLKKAIPLIKQVEEMRARVKMNGYFRYFDPLNF